MGCRWWAGERGPGGGGEATAQTTEITHNLVFVECLGLLLPFSSTLIQFNGEADGVLLFAFFK